MVNIFIILQTLETENKQKKWIRITGLFTQSNSNSTQIYEK